MRVYYLNFTRESADFESMQQAQQEELSWKRTVVCHASKDAFGPMTDSILSRLGYRMLLPATFARLRSEDSTLCADLLLVDERRLAEAQSGFDDAGLASAPIVLLTGKNGTSGAYSRIVGAVKRPAGLHDLYRLMQQVFEDTPRTTPRVATQLRAHCKLGEREWDGRVLSLSENGCLIRSREAIPLGRRIMLEFTLPVAVEVRLEAEAAYQLLPDVGLVFNSVNPAHRKTLEHFVTQTILLS